MRVRDCTYSIIILQQDIINVVIRLLKLFSETYENLIAKNKLIEVLFEKRFNKCLFSINVDNLW